MPLPTPKNDEEEQEFISRCMGDDVMNKDYSDQKQRAAVCYSQWREKHGGSKPAKSSKYIPIQALVEFDFGDIKS